MTCRRCDALLRHTRRDPIGVPLALYCAALMLLIISCTMTMLSVSRIGLSHNADMFSGPLGLTEHGLWPLGLLVLFTTIGAPLLKVLGSVYVLAGIRMTRPPRHLRWVYAWMERLRPWSMIEIYLLGVFVAYVKLGALVTSKSAWRPMRCSRCCWRWSWPMR